MAHGVAGRGCGVAQEACGDIHSTWALGTPHSLATDEDGEGCHSTQSPWWNSVLGGWKPPCSQHGDRRCCKLGTWKMALIANKTLGFACAHHLPGYTGHVYMCMHLHTHTHTYVCTQGTCAKEHVEGGSSAQRWPHLHSPLTACSGPGQARAVVIQAFHKPLPACHQAVHPPSKEQP